MKKKDAEAIAIEAHKEAQAYYDFLAVKLMNARYDAYAKIQEWIDTGSYRLKDNGRPHVSLPILTTSGSYFGLNSWREPDRNPGAPQKEPK